MLVQSAAFDTVNRDILLDILSVGFGVGDTVLNWIRSFLVDRSFLVKCRVYTGNVFSLKTRMPRGYVLGPVSIIVILQIYSIN